MLDSDKQGKQMTEREKFYISKFQKEYLNLKEGCQLWQKPGYSTLSKKLPPDFVAGSPNFRLDDLK